MLTNELVDHVADIPGVKLQSLLDYQYPGMLNLNLPFLRPSKPGPVKKLKIAGVVRNENAARIGRIQ